MERYGGNRISGKNGCWLDRRSDDGRKRKLFGRTKGGLFEQSIRPVRVIHRLRQALGRPEMADDQSVLVKRRYELSPAEPFLPRFDDYWERTRNPRTIIQWREHQPMIPNVA